MIKAIIKAIQQSIQVKLVLPIVLGALVIVSFSTISMFYINQTGTVRLAGLTGGALALLAAFVVVLLRRTVIKPMQALIATYERVSTGDLTARVPVQSNDEMGEISTGFNTLLDRLVNLIRPPRLSVTALRRYPETPGRGIRCGDRRSDGKSRGHHGHDRGHCGFV